MCCALALSSCVYDYSINIPVTYGENVTYKTPNYNSSYSASNLNKDLVGSTVGQYFLPSTGDSKILVIPIEFEDDTFTTAELETLENTFFGGENQTGWQSVYSYYYESSGGKLRLSGEVTNKCKLDMTVAELERVAATYSGNYTDEIVKMALEALDSSIDYQDYDSNGDGVIDAVWLVYSASYDRDSDLYWAYTTWASDYNTFDDLYYCQYSWASIEFLYEGGYSSSRSDTLNGDAHTFIHETGHLLGLDDYYSYDYDGSSNTDTPVGGIDMMDFNIGDNCSFSKYFLDWYEPTIITEEYLEENDYTLTLSSQTETGQFFLLPSYTDDGEMQYNNTALDEYLLIEYYTPTNLNEQDSKAIYNNTLRCYTEPGVLVYHVNATIGRIYVSGGSIVWDGYAYDMLKPLSALLSYEGYYYIFSNTKSYSYYEMENASTFYRGALISLLSATGRKISGYYANSRTINQYLYQEGDEFLLEGGIYDEFIFDDGTTPNYGFEVLSSDDDSCTLRFSAI